MAAVSAFEVGSIFINQYYRILQESPEYAYRFYNESSTLTRVDGDDTQTVSNLEAIHSALISLNVSELEVTKLNCQDSMSGGILLFVQGIMRSRTFSGKRRFTQAFFLAPQENGYFVLNDILHFNEEVVLGQHPVPETPEVNVDSVIPESSPRLEQPVSSYELEEASREYVNSIPIEEDNPVDKYSLLEEEQHEEPHIELETIVQEAPIEEPAALVESTVNHVHYVEESIIVPPEVTVGEPPKLSYASILQASKGKPSQTAVSKSSLRQSVPPPVEQKQTLQARAPELNPSASSFVPETTSAGSDEGLVQESELRSVYVKNLPSNVTTADLEKEFKKYGRIKPNGVFIRNKREIGVCFAFIEFEDMAGVQNAIKSSPIELLGRQVYIEERKPISTSNTRIGAVARGRGRGSYPNSTPRGRGGIRNPGRGILDSNNHNTIRGNGY
ncbi:nuclear transport factor 2-like [Amaranthus tricolor]|uniref:nuclear transport factor 2-like n=1 Tax=Amaranthus tricolor TaxID=29722 RepID=UPI002587F072|nr:nuclear transport factor 2-like [Amaranthus tricolor]